MAARLLTENIAGTKEKPLYIWNRTKSKCVDLKERLPDYEVVIKDSAKEVVEACSITYCMVSYRFFLTLTTVSFIFSYVICAHFGCSRRIEKFTSSQLLKRARQFSTQKLEYWQGSRMVNLLLTAQLLLKMI